jgi:hypothetical protein
MAYVNLRPVGYDVVVDLEGTATMHPGRAPLVILLAENHNDNNVIGQNIQSAVNLFDAKLVGVIGVEQFPPPPFDIKAKMAAEPGIKKDGGIAKFGKAMLEMFGGTVKGVVDSIRKTPNNRPQSFARNLILLRPEINIVGVEDPKLKDEAQAASEAAARLYLDESDALKREKLQIAAFRKRGEERERKRDEAFLRHALEAHASFGSPAAIVVNGGGLHLKRIAGILRQQGEACVLILPGGYTDALEK